MSTERGLQWVTLVVLVVALLGLNAAWLGQDRMVRDGDEEGHVGGAELFLGDVHQRNPGAFVKRALWQDMGDYPSLYPATVGGWWAVTGGGQPGRPAVRWVNLVWLGLAGVGAAGAARRLGADRLPSWLGGVAVLWLPLSLGLGRHFMPETAVAACVALAVWAAAHQREHPRAGPAFVLGLALGAGLLTKQTVVLYVALPVLVTVRWRVSLLWALPGVLIAAPWWVLNLGDQSGYLASSAGYGAEGGWLGALAYYPRALWVPALGPVWLAGTGLAVIAARTERRGLLTAGVWLAAIVVLALLPKKYDRLLVPALPAIGVIVALALHHVPKAAPALLLGAAWTTWLSLAPSRWSNPLPATQAFHPGCVQVWLRPPEPDDLGFALVADALQDARTVQLVDPPDIPCAVQTTHPWSSHLGPYLRRAGVETEILDGPAERTLRFHDAGETPVLGTGLDID